jgi:hypothetical protein
MDTLLDRVLSVLTVTSSRWQELTRSIPSDLINRAPLVGEWSASECLIHMIDIERVFQFRLQAFRDRRDFPDFNPDTEGTGNANLPAADLAERFRQLRSESLQQIEQITPAEYGLVARHAELGPVTLGQMLNEWAAHDFNHTIQAERALMQPFISECGPWRKYFTSQVIEG